MQTISKPKFIYLYYNYIRNPKLLLIFALTVFLFFNLTFATPQIIMISSVYASSNNKEGDESDLEESINEGNTSNQDKEQQDTGNDLSSSSSTESSKQGNRCSDETVKGPSYIDDKGCSVPCPSVNNQNEIMSEGCPQPNQQQQQEQLTAQNPTNLVDPSQGLTQYNNQLTINTLSNDALMEQKTNYDIVNDYAYLTITLTYNGPIDNQTDKKVCVETETGQNQKVAAVPHCLFKYGDGGGLISGAKYKVQAPGKVVLNIEKSLDWGVDPSPCSFYIYPNQDRTCHLEFVYRDMKNEPLPASDFGKSMVGS